MERSLTNQKTQLNIRELILFTVHTSFSPQSAIYKEIGHSRIHICILQFPDWPTEIEEWVMKRRGRTMWSCGCMSLI